MADFRPRAICALATPEPEVGGVQNLRVFINDWRIFAPTLKLIAITVQKLRVIENFFWKIREVGPFLKSAHNIGDG